MKKDAKALDFELPGRSKGTVPNGIQSVFDHGAVPLTLDQMYPAGMWQPPTSAATSSATREMPKHDDASQGTLPMATKKK